MPTVRIPSPLRVLTGGVAEVTIAADRLDAVIAHLDGRYPGLGERLLDDDGDLRRHVNVFVGDVDVRSRQGLDTSVAVSDVVSIVPAVAGG